MTGDSVRDVCRTRSVFTHVFRLTAGVALAALPLDAAHAQSTQGTRQCLLQYESTTGNTRTNLIKLPSERFNAFQGGGVTYRCEGQDNSLIADSAEYYGDQSVLFLIGSVHYSENRANVDSDRMTYYQLEDRLHADGNVKVRLQSGTTIRGPSMDYWRATPTRPQTQTAATGRPRMSLVQRSTPGQPAEPVDIVANTITAEGENFVYASGKVEITRPDLVARSDSAFMDSQREFARLMRSPSVESRRDKPFTLRGDVIDLFSNNRRLERVVAAPSGHALSPDLEIVADTVDLRVRENQLERIIAWGRSRARALTVDREMVADSIDARMPRQQLNQVRAVGKAYASSSPDTSRIVSAERDWIRGDTIIAEFDSLAPGDTASRPQAKRIIANGNASSFYQLPQSTREQSSRERALPNVNYVRGRLITISFADRAVNKVDVTDEATGLYLEPATLSPPASSETPSSTAPRPPPAPPPPSPDGGVRHDLTMSSP